MKQHSKKAIKEAERLGFRFTRINTNNFRVYEHPDAGEIAISPSLTENSCRQIVRRMQIAVSRKDETPGRNGSAVKERQKKRRELDAERIAAERTAVEAERSAFLLRVSGAPLLDADRADLARITARLDELRELERQMTDVPTQADHRGRSGRTRHRSGER